MPCRLAYSPTSLPSHCKIFSDQPKQQAGKNALLKYRVRLSEIMARAAFVIAAKVGATPEYSPLVRDLYRDHDEVPLFVVPK